MGSKETHKHYRRGVVWLDTYYPYFTTNVINMGRPIIDRNEYAARVRLAKDATSPLDFDIAYNPDYFEDKSDEETAAIFAHEALHILYGHFTEHRRVIRFPDSKRLMFAQELIVNDTLSAIGIDMPADEAHYGQDHVGFNTSGWTTEALYDYLEQEDVDTPDSIADPNGEPQDGEGEGESMPCGGGQGQDGQQDMSFLEQLTQSRMKHSSAPQGLKHILNLQDSTVEKESAAGAGEEFAELLKFARQNKVSVQWAELIRHVDPDMFKNGGLYGNMRTSWHTAPRKMASLQQHGIRVPTRVSRKSNERQGTLKPYIVLALDFSGSIPESTQDKLAALANSIPDAIDVDACTFSTEYVPFDYKAEDNKVASGGTDFSAVEGFVRQCMVKNNRKDYPKAVIVLTDGQAGFDKNTLKPTDDQIAQNWWWVNVSDYWSNPYDVTIDSEHLLDIKNLLTEDFKTQG